MPNLQKANPLLRQYSRTELVASAGPLPYLQNPHHATVSSG
jgi:hypothetical protein